MSDFPVRLRMICGHDSWTVQGCTTCEAADEIEGLTRSHAFHYRISNDRLRRIEAAEALLVRASRALELLLAIEDGEYASRHHGERYSEAQATAAELRLRVGAVTQKVPQ